MAFCKILQVNSLYPGHSSFVDVFVNTMFYGVSVGSSLGPVLANIILTEFENMIVKPLIETSVLKCYCRYVDDTLVMIKKDKIQHVLNSFNSFDKNLRFTVDTFDNGNIHFLDIKILNNGETDIYIKDISTRLYVQYHSYG